MSAERQGDQGSGEVRLTVRIPDQLHTRLKVYAAKQRRTVQEIVQEALEDYLRSRKG